MPSRLSRWWQQLHHRDNTASSSVAAHGSPRPQSEVLVLPAFAYGVHGEPDARHSVDRVPPRRHSYQRQPNPVADLQDVEPINFWKRDHDGEEYRPKTATTRVSAGDPRQDMSANADTAPAPESRSSVEDREEYHTAQPYAQSSKRNTTHVQPGRDVDIPIRASSLRFQPSDEPLNKSSGSPRMRESTEHDSAEQHDVAQAAAVISRKPVAGSPTSAHYPKEANGDHHEAFYAANESQTNALSATSHNPDVSTHSRNRTLSSGAPDADIPSLVRDQLSSSSEESIESIDEGQQQPAVSEFGKLPVRSVDTTVAKTWMPAVTHDVVEQHFHEIREERITRDIHTHDVYHRVLPIVDIQVLPARHFMLNEDGSKSEISEADIPGRTGTNQDWAVVERVTKSLAQQPLGPRRFTARAFEGAEGQHREYVTEDGIPRSETTWVHPPELETGARQTGQTEEFVHC